MQIFKKKCQLCNIKIEKDNEVLELVKVPEFLYKQEKPFCSEEHAEFYKENCSGTKNNRFCCGMPYTPDPEE